MKAVAYVRDLGGTRGFYIDPSKEGNAGSEGVS